jgi:Domain of unknown function DUF29
MSDTDLYDTDFVRWSERQADLLRRVANGERINDQVDWDNVIEEIESLARRDRQELHNRVVTILDHLMRLQASPASDPRRGWRSTVERIRGEIETILEGNRTLRAELPAILPKAHQTARRIAATALAEYGETPTVPVDQLTYSEDQVLGAWLP